jgi:hypothetical protein
VVVVWRLTTHKSHKSGITHHFDWSLENTYDTYLFEIGKALFIGRFIKRFVNVRVIETTPQNIFALELYTFKQLSRINYNRLSLI